MQDYYKVPFPFTSHTVKHARHEIGNFFLVTAFINIWNDEENEGDFGMNY